MAWLTHTRRVVRWTPLLVAFALALATLATERIVDMPLRGVELTISLLMIVIGALCGLHDPARDFVHPMPVPAARRLVHRLLVVAPAAAFAVGCVRLAASVLFALTPRSPGPGALVAFGAIGVALVAVLTRRVGARAADAAVSVMLAWLVGSMILAQLDIGLEVAMPWWRWPIAVASIAVAVAVVASTRGVEA